MDITIWKKAYIFSRVHCVSMKTSLKGLKLIDNIQHLLSHSSLHGLYEDKVPSYIEHSHNLIQLLDRTTSQPLLTWVDQLQQKYF